MSQLIFGAFTVFSPRGGPQGAQGSPLPAPPPPRPEDPNPPPTPPPPTTLSTVVFTADCTALRRHPLGMAAAQTVHPNGHR